MLRLIWPKFSLLHENLDRIWRKLTPNKKQSLKYDDAHLTYVSLRTRMQKFSVYNDMSAVPHHVQEQKHILPRKHTPVCLDLDPCNSTPKCNNDYKLQTISKYKVDWRYRTGVYWKANSHKLGSISRCRIAEFHTFSVGVLVGGAKTISKQ